MYYRCRLYLVNLFCLFLYSLIGCSEQSFNDRFLPEEKDLGVALHRAETFPQTFSVEGTTRELLLAGRREGFSCFFEFYQLDEATDSTSYLPKDKNWTKHKNGFFLREGDAIVNNRTVFESEVLLADGNHLMYAQFLGDDPHNLRKLFPALYR